MLFEWSCPLTDRRTDGRVWKHSLLGRGSKVMPSIFWLPHGCVIEYLTAWCRTASVAWAWSNKRLKPWEEAIGSVALFLLNLMSLTRKQSRGRIAYFWCLKSWQMFQCAVMHCVSLCLRYWFLALLRKINTTGLKLFGEPKVCLHWKLLFSLPLASIMGFDIQRHGQSLEN